MKNYLFPKLFKGMSARSLAEYCLSLGIDGPTLMIRDGYAVQQNDMFETLPRYVKEIRAAGAEVVYAETPFQMHELDKQDDALSLLCDNGIKFFRMDYIPKRAHNARDLHDVLCRGLEIAERAARKSGVKAVVQLHGTFYPHNATAAYLACKNFDPAYIGIKLDPGNNIQQEGYEEYGYQAELLGDYVVAIGQKDAVITRNAENGKWERVFAPATVGINDYDRIFAKVKKHCPDIIGIFMPFYHENDAKAMHAAFQEEVAYIKKCQEKNGL